MKISHVVGAVVTMAVVALATPLPAHATSLSPNGTMVTAIASGAGAMTQGGSGVVTVTAQIACGALASGGCSNVTATLHVINAAGMSMTRTAGGRNVAKGGTSVQTFRFHIGDALGVATVHYNGSVSVDTCGGNLTNNCITLTDTSPTI